MRKSIFLLFIVSGLILAAHAEKKFKPWAEWSVRDAARILNDSPWAQTQSEYNVSEMFFLPTTRSGTGSSESRDAQGAFNQSVALHLRIRFLSAKPIRQAFARTILAAQAVANPKLEASLKDFIERKFDEFIVVAVGYDSEDRRLSGPAMQLFNSAITSTLQNNTYLELKNGERLFLQEYKPPINDGLGAKFVFPRTMKGKPFIGTDSGEVRFYSEMGKLKLNQRFKVADMMYEGTLEH